MAIRPNNYAFIDANNLHLSVQEQGWAIDYWRFRRYLFDKYSVKEAFLFLGYVKTYQKMYDGLERDGYKLIFKPTLLLPDGKPKGNVDGELILHTMIEYPNFEKAIIVAGDGDYFCLIEYLLKNDKLERLIIPNKDSYSYLLRKFNKYITFASDIRRRIEFGGH